MRFNAMLFGIVLAFSLVSASTYSVVPLTYAAFAADTYRVAAQEGDVACAPGWSGDWIYDGAKLIEMKSTSAIFGGPGDALSGDYYFSKVLFDPIGLTGTGSISLNGTYFQSTNPAQWAPRVFWKLPGRDCWNWNNVIFTAPAIKVNAAGDPGTSWGYIKFEDALISGATKHTMVLNEGIGIGGANSAIEYISNPSYMTMRFKENDGDTSEVYYLGSVGGSYVPYEPTFVTERGTRWLSVGTSDASAQIATKLAKPNFVFRTSAPPVGSTTWPQYSFETLITDTVDRTPKNRQNTLPEDEYASLLSSPDTGGAVTSPLRAVEPGTTVAKNMYRIGGNEYAPFSDYVVADYQAPGFNYIEKQAYWIGTTPSGVAYDAGAAYRDVIVNKYSAMATSAKFEANDFGIPVCTGGLAISGDWTSCVSLNNQTGSVNSLTDRHRVGIKFLNQNWIISEMIAPTSQLASSAAAINGGQMRLAKESKYGILMVNQTLYNTPLSVRLADISVATSCNYGERPAIYDVLGTNNAVVGQVQVCPGTTYTFVQQGTGSKVMIHTYQTHPGSTPTSEWAETAIYSEEIVLKDGMRYNLVSSSDPDKNFKVSLLWKNRDYAGAGSSTVADSLREIVVYQTDNFEKTPRMGVYHFLSSQPAFRVTYAGIRPNGAMPGPVPKPVPVDIIKKEEPAPVGIADETAKARQEIAPVSTKATPSAFGEQLPKATKKPIIKAKPKVQSSETVAQTGQVTDPPAAEKTRAEKAAAAASAVNARTEKGAAPPVVQPQPKPGETPASVKETVRSTASEKGEAKASEQAKTASDAKRAEASDQ